MSINSDIFEQLYYQSNDSDFSDLSNNSNATNQRGSYNLSEGKDIFELLHEENKKDKSFGFLETVRDIGEQVAAKGVAGVVGSYGNILETFGLQAKEGAILPGQEERYSQQFHVLEKLNRGEVPSYGEMMLLSDDEGLGSLIRFPTSKEVQSGIERFTGIREGKTPEGRIAGRGAEFVGEGLALPGSGVKGLVSLGAAGTAGQGIREVSGPESLASSVEIGGSILPSVVQGRVNPRNVKDKKFVESARNMGFTEKEISPLIQSPKKIATIKPLARKGTKTQKLFDDISNKAGLSYDELRKMPNAKTTIPMKNSSRLNSEFNRLRDNLSNTLQASPDKQSAINFIDGAISELEKNGASPEKLINFWQDINSAVNWNSIRGGRKQLAALKEPLSEAIQSVSPQINKRFMEINELYSRYKNISSKLKPDLVDSFVNKGEIVSAIPSGLALVHGNPMPLAGLGGEVATRLLAREMLINPYFQNLANKLVANFNQGSVKAITESVKQAQEYMERKHPETDWSFLIKD